MVDKGSPVACYRIIAAAAVAAQLLPTPSVLRTAIAAPLVLFLPGYAIIRTAFADRWPRFETAVLAVGLCLAICALSGLVLHVAGFLTPLGWSLILGGITLAAGFLEPSVRDASHNWALPAFEPSQWAMMAMAGTLAISAICISRMSAFSHREFSFTEFWLTPSEPGSNRLTIGVASHERDFATFDAEIRIDGRISGLWSAIRLKPGEAWSAGISPPHRDTAGRGWRAEAVLFKDANYEQAYRKVWASSTARLRKAAESGQRSATDTAMIGGDQTPTPAVTTSEAD